METEALKVPFRGAWWDISLPKADWTIHAWGQDKFIAVAVGMRVYRITFNLNKPRIKAIPMDHCPRELLHYNY